MWNRQNCFANSLTPTGTAHPQAEPNDNLLAESVEMCMCFFTCMHAFLGSMIMQIFYL